MNQDANKSWALGVGVVLTTALLWSALSLWLYSDGLSPSGPSPFEEHYRVQAVLLPVILSLASHVFAWVLWRFVGPLPQVSWGAWCGRALTLYGVGLGLGWVIPDLAAYGMGGFESIKALAPILPLVSTLAVGIPVVRFLRAQGVAGLGRCIGGICLAWLAQSVVLMAVVS